MYLCKVAGKVVCTIKLPSLGAGSLIFVNPLDADGSEQKKMMVAYDSIGCGEGDVILVTGGCNARFGHSSQDAPIDLVVVGIVDNYEYKKEPGNKIAAEAKKVPDVKKTRTKK